MSPLFCGMSKSDGQNIASWFDHAMPGNAPPKKWVHAKRSKGGWAHDFFRLCCKDVNAFARSLAKQQTSDQVPVSSTTGESCSQLPWRGVNGSTFRGQPSPL
jgi:hypothetical protein